MAVVTYGIQQRLLHEKKKELEIWEMGSEARKNLGKCQPSVGHKKAWSPKNPEIKISVESEAMMSEAQWQQSRFPFFAIPDKVSTHVKTDVWSNKVADHRQRSPIGGEIDLLQLVLRQLEEGVDSCVSEPGNSVTITRNLFPTPSIDIPRIADSLATEVKAGHMAGPFAQNSIPDAKINGIIAVEKPDGSRRQVGNLSAPKGKSFNDGIDEGSLKEWRVVQTTAATFASMVARSGPGAWLSCCDMTNAYKCLPVCLSQRKLQCFRFLGKDFMDLRLIFGDRAACMHFDRFHECILKFFVFPLAPVPPLWVGRTIDDVPTVVPQKARALQQRFVEEYKGQLSELGIGFAQEDPERRKAFKGETSGEILGVWFDTQDMSWRFLDSRLDRFLTCLHLAMESDEMSLHDAEVLFGRTINFAQLISPLMLLIGDSLQFLRTLLEQLKERDEGSSKRAGYKHEIPPEFKHDMRTVASIVESSRKCPLPLLRERGFVMADAVVVYTDASGHLIDNPSLGLYSPMIPGVPALVGALALPRFFLLSTDALGKKCFCKTTSLECLGFLATLCWDPLRFVGRKVLFMIDNVASSIALTKGYSSGDPWATTIVRATRVVASGLGASVASEWEPRRSSKGGEIADNLSHNILSGLQESEIEAYLERRLVRFPQPILNWMSRPCQDQGLGLRCLRWLRKEFPSVRMFKPRDF